MSAHSGRVLWFYKLARFVLYILYRLFFRFKAFGAENVPAAGGGVILAPNHASYLDPPILGISLKRPVTYLAKEYLFKAFLLGPLLSKLGALPIKSESDDFRSIRAMVRALKDGECMVIFPDGTRSLDGNLKEAEDGVGFLALKSGAVVVPVYIRGSYDAYPKGAKCFRMKPIRTHYGKPFVPKEDAEILAAENPYGAVSRRIMKEIRAIKEAADKEKF